MNRMEKESGGQKEEIFKFMKRHLTSGAEGGSSSPVVKEGITR